MPLAGTETERGEHSPYDPGKEFQLSSSQVLSFSSILMFIAFCHGSS